MVSSRAQVSKSEDSLLRDAREWATTLEYAGFERNGVDWKDAGISRSDADELAAILRDLVARLETPK